MVALFNIEGNVLLMLVQPHVLPFVKWEGREKGLVINNLPGQLYFFINYVACLYFVGLELYWLNFSMRLVLSVSVILSVM